ncbi:MAG: cell division protein FtsZ, partial [Dehalococcoidia bacterium]|nr:cell division protein FtsZ [Dehalococcoidia bacterium]
AAGGAGCNAVNRMIQADIHGVDFIQANTDAQALMLCLAPNVVQLGEKCTKGLGSGGDNNTGSKATEESRDDIKDLLKGADMVFIAAGMGGGTGTGGAPVIAEIARDVGALTIAVVTRPFTFEGVHRRDVAEDGLEKLVGHVDTLIIVPNDRLLQLCDSKVSVDSAFKMADDALRQGVQSIAEVITVPGMINLDFADIKSIMKNAGPAWMSIGHAAGQNRAVDAAKAAISSPLLDCSIEGAKGVVFTVSGGSSLMLHEVREAADIIAKAVDPAANIIFGVNFDPNMDEDVKITLIATGFMQKRGPMSKPKEQEIRQALTQSLKDESTLDVPAFLRMPPSHHRKQAMAEAMKSALNRGAPGN